MSVKEDGRAQGPVIGCHKQGESSLCFLSFFLALAFCAT
jgi:hypothetical protein